MVTSVCKNESTSHKQHLKWFIPLHSCPLLTWTKSNQVNPRMGSATNNTVRNINPAKQKQHCFFRKAKHLFFIFRTIKLKHSSRTNNSHSYWVKSRLISGTFKDLHISPTESAELGNLVYLNHIQMKIKVNSYKMAVKYSHIRRDYISKPDTDEKNQKSHSSKNWKKYLYAEAYKVFRMYLQSVSYTISDLIYILRFAFFSVKVKKIVTFHI